MTKYRYQAIAKHIDSEDNLIGFTIMLTNNHTEFWDTVTTKEEMQSGTDILNLRLDSDDNIIISNIVKEIFEDKSAYELLDEVNGYEDPNSRYLELDEFLKNLSINPVSINTPGLKFRFSSDIRFMALDEKLNNLYLCGNSKDIQDEIKLKTAKAKMIGAGYSETKIDLNFYMYDIGMDRYIIDTSGELVLGDLNTLISHSSINKITFRNCIIDEQTNFCNFIFDSSCNYIDMSELDISNSEIVSAFEALEVRELKLGNLTISKNTEFLFTSLNANRLKIENLSIEDNYEFLSRTFFKSVIDNLEIGNSQDIKGKLCREIFSKCYIGTSNLSTLIKYDIPIDLNKQEDKNKYASILDNYTATNKLGDKITKRSRIKIKVLANLYDTNRRLYDDENAKIGYTAEMVSKYVDKSKLLYLISKVYKENINPIAVTFNFVSYKIKVYLSDGFTMHLTLVSDLTGYKLYKPTKNDKRLSDLIKIMHINDIMITKSASEDCQIILAFDNTSDLAKVYEKDSKYYKLYKDVSASFIS